LLSKIKRNYKPISGCSNNIGYAIIKLWYWLIILTNEKNDKEKSIVVEIHVKT